MKFTFLSVSFYLNERNIKTKALFLFCFPFETFGIVYDTSEKQKLTLLSYLCKRFAKSAFAANKTT